MPEQPGNLTLDLVEITSEDTGRKTFFGVSDKGYDAMLAAGDIIGLSWRPLGEVTVEEHILTEKRLVWCLTPDKWHEHYTFDDLHIGVPSGKGGLATRLIKRPPGLTNDVWYQFAAKVCEQLAAVKEAACPGIKS